MVWALLMACQVGWLALQSSNMAVMFTLTLNDMGCQQDMTGWRYMTAWKNMQYDIYAT